jgi:plastocyanin
VRRVIVVVFSALLVCAGASCSKGSTAVSCQDPAQATTVDLQDFAYSPVCTAAASDATLTLQNTGSQPHSFTVKGTEVNVMVGAGQRSDASLAGIGPGTYQVTCTLHPQMVGALKIG